MPGLPVVLQAAVGVGGLESGLGMVERNSRNRIKSRLQAKGMPSLPPLPALTGLF